MGAVGRVGVPHYSDPGRVFDRTVGRDGVPDGYRAMNEREARKGLIRP